MKYVIDFTNTGFIEDGVLSIDTTKKVSGCCIDGTEITASKYDDDGKLIQAVKFDVELLFQKQNEELKEQAKEIIREYMRFEPMIGTCSFYSEEYEKTKKKAEAFLNK